MKKHAPLTLSIAACILSGLCLLRIHALEGRISQLHSTINSQTNQLLSGISGIRSEVENELEAAADLLSESAWSYGEIDVEARTAEILCSLVPKVYSPGTTEVSLFFDGLEVPMQYENGQYTASAQLPLFEEIQTPRLLLEDEGVIRSQTLPWYFSPRQEVLPRIYAGSSGSFTWKDTADAQIGLSCNSTVDIFAECKTPFQIRSMELVEVLNGEEIGRLPIDLSEEGQQSVQGAMAERGEAIPAPELMAEERPAGDDFYTGALHLFYVWEKEYTIPYGGMLELYLDTVDGHGLRYRSCVDCFAVTQDGTQDDRRMESWRILTHAEPKYIFDEGGELIFELSEDLYS